jgi:hypothetical protein
MELNKRIALILVTLIFVWTRPLFAEESIEVSETENIITKNQWALFELAGFSSSGNSKTGSFFLGTDLYKKGDKYMARFDGSAYYSEDATGVHARIIEGQIAPAHLLNDRSYIVVHGYFKHDLFQKLNLRSSIGMAYGFSAVKASFEELIIEAGLGLQNENFRDAKGDDYTEARLGIRYILSFSNTSFFENRTYILPSLENKKDFRIRSEFKFNDTIYKELGLLFKVLFDYDGSPADDEVDKLDKIIFGGVTYNFM